jgi:hypothetical protein
MCFIDKSVLNSRSIHFEMLYELGKSEKQKYKKKSIICFTYKV